MDNKTIAQHFKLLAQVMEYLGENPFKIRSYKNAYDTLRKLDEPVAGKSSTELAALDGIGKAISEKIVQLNETGHLELLDRYLAESPADLTDLLGIRGLGPKRVRVIVDALGVKNRAELLQAINENRLAEVKGFSFKSQDKIKKQLEFDQLASGFARYADVLPIVEALEEAASQTGINVVRVGPLARQQPTLSTLDFQIPSEQAKLLPDLTSALTDATTPEPLTESGNNRSFTVQGFPVRVFTAGSEDFGLEQLRRSAAAAWLKQHPQIAEQHAGATEAAVFEAAGLPYTPAPQREAESPWPPTPPAELIQVKDIRGIIHAHTTWSDGATPLPELVEACRSAGFEFLTITDHSRTAAYANGLSVERLLKQGEEIRELNARYDDFTIFWGTESDILRDGSLDYPPEILEQLDVVIASVHSVLQMDEEEATERIVRAIENPHFDILGHPTGRLLLGRAGYPLDYERIFQACVDTGAAIEINASPSRLDLDWTQIDRATQLGIPLCINPDAHSINGLQAIRYGVLAAQKGGLRARDCLNALSAEEFGHWLKTHRRDS